jgi:nucleoid-associated protein YgaU
MFAPGSRYAAVPDRIHELPDGRRVTYKALRIISTPAAFEAHTVRSGDRLDRLAHRYLGDPERFWRICDANRALRPDDVLAVLGRRLRIPGDLG